MEPMVAAIVIGLREVAWPKGEGYLYWRFPDSGDEHHLLDLELNDTPPGEVDRILLRALSKIAANSAFASRGGTLHVRPENMSVLAKEALVRAVGMHQAEPERAQAVRFELSP